MASKIAALALSLVFASQAHGATFSQFVSFGDSTIDSGWWVGALNGQCGGVSAPCTTGTPAKDARIADAIANGGTGAPVGVGLMPSQILAASYGLTAIPANQPGGTNYAISGSKNAPSGGLGNLNANPNLPSTIGQIATYLSQNGGVANPTALYYISSGGNDVSYALDNFTTLAQRQAYLANQAAALANGVRSLQSAGATNIVVNGLAGSGTLALFYTQTLFADLTGVGVDYLGIDIRSIVQQVQANPTLYGFTPATVLPGVLGTGTASACVASFGTGWGQWCANTTTPSTQHAYLRSLDAELTSFYSDDQHFSAAGNQIVANFERELIEAHFATTPLPAALPLFATGAGLLGWIGLRRRRAAQATAP